MCVGLSLFFCFFFFFNDTATTEIYTLSLHDALPISQAHAGGASRRLVRCKQNWTIAATDRDVQRMADFLPWSKTHALGLPVSIGPGSLRARESGEMPAPGRFVDLR